ncbi:hypothetical protein AVEN_234897-1 [Araneus ventricosus]|uniref:Uncharacterized protein n=1 Tax=Araneus ventricosus TaxID=182803 RepID=A0A4Y2H485_ARAVE|nr:hypothetical protein AVEN_234897-1 [Araneus ventricosus]
MEPQFCSVRTTSSTLFFLTKSDCTLREAQHTAGSRHVNKSHNSSVVSLGAVKPLDLQVVSNYPDSTCFINDLPPPPSISERYHNRVPQPQQLDRFRYLSVVLGFCRYAHHGFIDSKAGPSAKRPRRRVTGDSALILKLLQAPSREGPHHFDLQSDVEDVSSDEFIAQQFHAHGGRIFGRIQPQTYDRRVSKL